jgi:hypothetical protein
MDGDEMATVDATVDYGSIDASAAPAELPQPVGLRFQRAQPGAEPSSFVLKPGSHSIGRAAGAQ